MKKLIHNKTGFALIVMVLVMGAVALTVVTVVFALGIGSTMTSTEFVASHQAKALANACAEEALEQVRASTAYTGTGSLSLSTGSCSYTVSNTGGETRSITTNATVRNMTRRVAITVTAINPYITISSWQEVAN